MSFTISDLDNTDLLQLEALDAHMVTHQLLCNMLSALSRAWRHQTRSLSPSCFAAYVVTCPIHLIDNIMCTNQQQ